MKDYLRYHRLMRLNRVSKIRFLQMFAQLFMIIALLNIYFFAGNIAFDVFLFSIFVAAFGTIYVKSFKEDINLSINYPISHKKRILYDLIYIVLNAFLAIIVLYTFFLIILGIIYLVNPSSIEINDSSPVDVTNKTLYYYAWVISYFEFAFMLIYIKKDKLWWLVLLLGNLFYLAINVAVVSILTQNFKFFGNTSELINNFSHSKTWIHLLSVLLFATIPFYYFSTLNIVKPKKVNN